MAKEVEKGAKPFSGAPLMENFTSQPDENHLEDGLDIQDVESPSEYTSAKWKGKWKRLSIKRWESPEEKEQRRMRIFLTCSTMLLWGAWTFEGLRTLDPRLILTSPPMLIIIKCIINYYFPRSPKK